MLEHIGGIESYDFFVNLGSVLGSILLIALYYHKNRSWKKTAAVYLLSLAVLQAGMFAGRLVRGLSYGEDWNIIHIITKPNGNHFIGRVLFAMLVFPLLYCLIFRKKKKEWLEYLDILCIFLAFQHIFNRIACLCGGCCMGKPYSGICAFLCHVDGKTGAGFSYPVFPTQIFEIICMIVLRVLLLVFCFQGRSLTWRFCFGFAVCIFVSEFMMDQTGVLLIGGLSVIQYAAVALFAAGIWFRNASADGSRHISGV